MSSRWLAFLLPVVALFIVAGMGGAVLLTRDDGAGTGANAGAQPRDDGESSSPRLAPQASVCQGILHRPDPGAPRTFPAEYTQRREAAGFTIVANAEVDPEALDEAAETVERFFRDNDLEEPLIAEGAYVIVAEADQGVLDLPEFRCMDTRENADFFSHVCGVADRANYPVVTVNELDLLGKRRGPCGGLNILYHELGHLVQGWALPPAEYFDVRQFYQDALNAGKYRKEYAATNANEYFAEATQAYFLSADTNGRRDREWLEEYDPQIYQLLAGLYGE